MFSPARVFALSSLLGLLVATTGRSTADDKPIDLNIGDKPPTFQLHDDKDKTWSSSDHFGKKWVVIYFYRATSPPVARHRPKPSQQRWRS